MSVVVPRCRYSGSILFAFFKCPRRNVTNASRYFNSVGSSRNCHSWPTLYTLSNADIYLPLLFEYAYGKMQALTQVPLNHVAIEISLLAELQRRRGNQMSLTASLPSFRLSLR